MIILLTSTALLVLSLTLFLRAKESPSHLIGVLSHRVEEDIEADFHAMTSKRKKP